MSLHSLMFGWEYPPLHLGGLGVACQGLVGGLLSSDIKVTLVLPHPLPTGSSNTDVISPTKELVDKVRVQSFLSPYISADEYQQNKKYIPEEMLQIYGNDLPQAVAHFEEVSAEMTKDTNPDVVHCHDWMTYGAGIRAASHHHKPLVAHIHATELDRTHFSPNEWIYKLERRGFNAADKIIAVSNYTKRILIDHYGISPGKIVVVHNGSQMERAELESNIQSKLQTTKQYPMVLFLGRMTTQKGPLHFLDMAAQVHALRPEVQFVIAGDGGMMGEVMNRACELGLEECTIFAGKVSNTEAEKLYKQADCFVMPSLSEPFGLVALEAIAQGTPVIMSKQSGVSEVVGHGFKVDFWDTAMMADCVLTILREQPLATQLTSYAPDTLHQLTWHKQAGHVKSIYQQIIPSFSRY